MQKIKLSQALAMLCNPNTTHDIRYRKASEGQLGKAGKKEGVTIRNAAGDAVHFLNATKKFGADGIAKLYQPKGDHTFDVVIDLITHIDGMVIEHPYI